MYVGISAQLSKNINNKKQKQPQSSKQVLRTPALRIFSPAAVLKPDLFSLSQQLLDKDKNSGSKGVWLL